MQGTLEVHRLWLSTATKRLPCGRRGTAMRMGARWHSSRPRGFGPVMDQVYADLTARCAPAFIRAPEKGIYPPVLLQYMQHRCPCTLLLCTSCATALSCAVTWEEAHWFLSSAYLAGHQHHPNMGGQSA